MRDLFSAAMDAEDHFAAQGADVESVVQLSPHKYDREHRHSVVLRGVELHYSCEGAVFWSDDWARAYTELASDGLLRREPLGPATYGDVQLWLEPVSIARIQ